MKFKIAIGSDHAGFLLKQRIIEKLKIGENEIKDFGCYSNGSCDYPDYGHLVANAVNSSGFEKGILICGTGNGICMVANKYEHIRAALCWNQEITELARKHNDANIICLPARFMDFELAVELVHIFLTTAFEGGRHLTRINKIAKKSN